MNTLNRKSLGTTSVRSNRHGTALGSLEIYAGSNHSRIPPNCHFEVDDFELSWSYSKPFDYIHGRELEGFVRDHDHVFRQAYDHLAPNGWFEIASIEVLTTSDDDTHLRAKNMVEVVRLVHEASKTFGKDMSTVPTWKERVEKAGFINVTEEIYKVHPFFFFFSHPCPLYLALFLAMLTSRLAPPKSLAQRPQI